MEITQATTSVNYVKSSKKIDEVNKTKSSFDMSKPFDVKSFTFEDFKKISGKDLSNWTKDHKKIGLSQDTHWLKMIASYTDDDTLNRILFDKAKKSYIATGNTSEFFWKVLTPLELMNMPREPQKEDFKLGLNSKNNFLNEPSIAASSPYYKTYDQHGYYVKSNALLDDMKKLPEWYENVLTIPEITIHIDLTSSIEYLNDIISEYEKAKVDNNSSLNQYTRNTRQDAIYA